MKKLLGALLSITLCFGLLAGCGPKEGGVLDPANPITVTLWHYYDGDLLIALESQVEEFNLSIGVQEGVIVKPIAVGNITDLEDSITESAQGIINSAAMPDMFFSYADKAIEVDGYTDLVDLTEYFDSDALNGYVESFINDGYVDGRLIVMPLVKSTELLYLNETDFTAFAMATGYGTDDLATWEGLYEVAAAYYEWSGGMPFFGFDAIANFMVVGNKQLGVEVLQGDGGVSGSVNLDKAALRQIFDIAYNGYVLGYFADVGRFRSDDVKTGELLAYTGSSSGASYFPTKVITEDETYDIAFTALPYPAFEAGERYTVQQGAGVVVVASDEARQQGCARFLEWFTGVTANVNFAVSTGYLPVMKDAYTSDELADGLATLRAGDEADNIIADVYEVSRAHIVDGNAYAARSFNGSYSARSKLSYALMDIIELDMEIAAGLRADGLTDTEILEQLGADTRFAEWLATVQDSLDYLEIPYTLS